METLEYQFAGQDLPHLLATWAGTKAEHPFLIWEPKDGQHRVWTYGEFWAQVRRLASGLAARGVQIGERVLIHSDNCPEMVLGWYACAALGAVGVTTNTRSVGSEIAYFIDHAECVAAITQPRYVEVVAENGPKLRWIAVTADDSGEPATAAPWPGVIAFDDLDIADAGVADRPAEPMRPVGIMYTSGTTSRPKAVVHTHANALWAGRVGPSNIGMGGNDTYLIYLPFFHVNAQSWSTFTTLGVGGTIVLQPKFSASRFWEVVMKHSVTHISLIPFVFKAIAGQPMPKHHLKAAVFGAVTPELEPLLGCQVLPAFGMTETVIHATSGGIWQHIAPRSMGKPTPGYEVAIVDPETGALCAEGEVGELWFRGRRGIELFLEYLNNPEANAKAFTEDGWFKTGDMVSLGEGGNIFYKERDKDLLKVGAENVSAREIEDVCRRVAGVGDVAVVGRSHPMLDVVPVAFVIAGPNAAPALEMQDAIISLCKDHLSDFKVPRAVYVVEDFPRATLDKVAKNQLRDLAETLPTPAQ